MFRQRLPLGLIAYSVAANRGRRTGRNRAGRRALKCHYEWCSWCYQQRAKQQWQLIILTRGKEIHRTLTSTSGRRNSKQQKAVRRLHCALSLAADQLVPSSLQWRLLPCLPVLFQRLCWRRYDCSHWSPRRVLPISAATSDDAAVSVVISENDWNRHPGRVTGGKVLGGCVCGHRAKRASVALVASYVMILAWSKGASGWINQGFKRL